MQPLRDFVRAAEHPARATQGLRDLRADGRERYKATYVLICPDEFVVWAGTEGQMDALAVLSKAIGAG